MAISLSLFSPIAASLLVFIDAAEDWYLVQIAALAPIVAWLSVRESVGKTMLEGILLALGGGLGVGLGWLWLHLQSLLFDPAHSLSQYLGVLLNIPLVGLLTIFRLPEGCQQAQAIALLCIYTLTIYGQGDYQAGAGAWVRVGSPAKVGLAVLGGSASAILGSFFGSFLLIKTHSQTRNFQVKFTLAQQKIGAFLADTLFTPESSKKGTPTISPAPLTSIDPIRAAAVNALKDLEISSDTEMSTKIQAHGIISTDTLRSCFSQAAAVREGCTDRVAGVEISRCIARVVEGDREQAGDLESLIDSAFYAGSIVDPRLLGALRDFVKSSRLFGRIRGMIDLHEKSVFSETARFFITPKQPISKSIDFRFAIRMTVLCTLLGIFLVIWDTHDSTVDAYSLWALLPALMLATNASSVGQVLLDGSRSFLACIVGGGLGVVSVVVNGHSVAAYASQFLLIVGISAFLKYSKGFTNVTLLPVAWAICGLANLRDEPNASLKDLWRNSLYRDVILCAGLVISAFLSFLIFPVTSSEILRKYEKSLIDDIYANFQSALNRITAIASRPSSAESLVSRSQSFSLLPDGEINPMTSRVLLAERISGRAKLLQHSRIEEKMWCFLLGKVKMAEKEKVDISRLIETLASFLVATNSYKPFMGVPEPLVFGEVKISLSDFINDLQNGEIRERALEVVRASGKLRSCFSEISTENIDRLGGIALFSSAQSLVDCARVLLQNDQAQ